jgi:hypothetical protein
MLALITISSILGVALAFAFAVIVITESLPIYNRPKFLEKLYDIVTFDN